MLANPYSLVRMHLTSADDFLRAVQEMNIFNVFYDETGYFSTFGYRNHHLSYQVEVDAEGAIRDSLARSGFSIVENSLPPSAVIGNLPATYVCLQTSLFDHVTLVHFSDEGAVRKALMELGAVEAKVDRILSLLHVDTPPASARGRKVKSKSPKNRASHNFFSEARVINNSDRVYMTIASLETSIDPVVGVQRGQDGIYTLLFSYRDQVRQQTAAFAERIIQSGGPQLYRGKVFFNSGDEDGPHGLTVNIRLEEAGAFAELAQMLGTQRVCYSLEEGQFTTCGPDGFCFLQMWVGGNLGNDVQSFLISSGLKLWHDITISADVAHTAGYFRMRAILPSRGQVIAEFFDPVTVRCALENLGVPSDAIETVFTTIAPVTVPGTETKPPAPPINLIEFPLGYIPPVEVQVAVSQPGIAAMSPIVEIERRKNGFYWITFNYKRQLQEEILAFKQKLETEGYVLFQGIIMP